MNIKFDFERMRMSQKDRKWTQHIKREPLLVKMKKIRSSVNNFLNYLDSVHKFRKKKMKRALKKHV